MTDKSSAQDVFGKAFEPGREPRSDTYDSAPAGFGGPASKRMIGKNVAVAGALLVGIVSCGVGISVGWAVGSTKGYADGRYEASRAASAATVELMTRGINVTEGDGAGKKYVLRPVEVTTDLDGYQAVDANRLPRKMQELLNGRTATATNLAQAEAAHAQKLQAAMAEEDRKAAAGGCVKEGLLKSSTTGAILTCKDGAWTLPAN